MTGSWSKKAVAEAKRYARVNVRCDGGQRVHPAGGDLGAVGRGQVRALLR